MDDTKTYFPKDIIDTVNKVMENRVYGSVQIYFEDGVITQITQTTIKKLNHKSAKNERPLDQTNKKYSSQTITTPLTIK